MKRYMVRYKVKPGTAQENEAAVRAVFDELRTARPDGFRYATFKLEDGVSFLHFVSVETGDGSNPIDAMKAFQAFQAGLRTRCEEKPQLIALEDVDSYSMFVGA